jgi:hypothetical protein
MQAAVVRHDETQSPTTEVQVQDARGRTITLRKPGVLAQYRLVEALGEVAKNVTYVDMIFPLLFVSAIDGKTVPLPAKKSEIEALIQRLDEDGIAAVMLGVQDKFNAPVGAEGNKTAVEK